MLVKAVLPRPQLVYFHQKKYNIAMEVLRVSYITTKEPLKNWEIAYIIVI
ncbi:hypothetical protein [Clostridioides sp. ES-S-0048-02]|nr:hypothetical protein [Clostridioides sp. ES-S-0048-02]